MPSLTPSCPKILCLFGVYERWFARFWAAMGVVAWTLTPLVSVVACLLEGAINAAQIQR